MPQCDDLLVREGLIGNLPLMLSTEARLFISEFVCRLLLLGSTKIFYGKRNLSILFIKIARSGQRLELSWK